MTTRRQEMYGVEASSMNRRRARARACRRSDTTRPRWLSDWRRGETFAAYMYIIVKYVAAYGYCIRKRHRGSCRGCRDAHGTHTGHTGHTGARITKTNLTTIQTQRHKDTYIHVPVHVERVARPPCVGKEKTPSPCVGKKRLPCRALASTFVALAT